MEGSGGAGQSLSCFGIFLPCWDKHSICLGSRLPEHGNSRFLQPGGVRGFSFLENPPIQLGFPWAMAGAVGLEAAGTLGHGVGQGAW